MAADKNESHDPQTKHNPLFQILRRWRVQAYLDFMWMTRDFKFFFINVVADFILSLSGVVAVFLLAERFSGIGMWSRDQVVFMLGYAAVVEGTLEMFCSYNVLHISRRIGRGQLDHTLVQPQPLWMALLTEGFMPFSGFWGLLAGIGISAWAFSGLDMAFSLGWWLCYAGHLLSSCLVIISFSYLWSTLAFWSPLGAEEISSEAVAFTRQLKSFPLDGVHPLLVKGLLSVVPVGFVAWYPSRVLLGIDAGSGSLWTTPLFAGALSLVALIAFKKGLDHYGQTGSQRYVRWGHRS
jgi:ABC-2 type transport system permease protein